MMRKKICVLEDDEGIREIIVMLLAEEDYEVRGFASVAEFMNNSGKPVADLFVLDIMLPDGNGIEVCSRLKKNKNTQHIPVLMMSANSSKMEVECSCNAQGFVAKPFDIYDLIDKVHLTITSPC